MSDERVVEADGVRVFLQEDGIVLEFGCGSEDEGSESVEIVSRVLVAPATFRRLGMSLHEALRKLPRERSSEVSRPPFTPPPPPVSAAPPSPASRISFIGAGGAPGGEKPQRPADTGAPAGPRSGGGITVTPTVRRTSKAKAVAPGGPGETQGGAGKPPLEALLEPTRNLPSSRAPAPVSREHATRLLRSVEELGAPYVHERSFRMRQGELLPNRFLLSVGRPADGSATDEGLARVFHHIGLPEPLLEAALPDLPRARCVHFGFEGDGDSPLLKVYLEVGGEENVATTGERGAEEGRPSEERGAEEGTPSDDDAAAADVEPVLEHVAFKWDPVTGEPGVVGRYWWYPHLSAEQLRSRVAGIYQGASPESQQIAFGVIELAAANMPERDIHYLEIEEESNPRRSYSINFYDADLKLRDLHPLLSRMRRLFDVPAGQFQVLYDQIKGRRFGHLAGGVHRNGRDFFNVYYGPQFFDRGAPPGPWRGALVRHGVGADE